MISRLTGESTPSSFVSQAVGAKDSVGIARGVQRGVLIGLALSLPTALLLIPGKFFLGALRQPAEVTPIAAAFSRWSILGVVPFSGSSGSPQP